MNSYIRYAMQGFNRQHLKCDNQWEITLTDDQEYKYENHPFLHSVFIDEHLTSITFKLKEGLRLEDYAPEISLELEKITFNIISRVPNLPIDKPLCILEAAMDYDGQQYTCQLRDYLTLHDEIYISATQVAQPIYEMGLSHQVAMRDNKGKYQEIFCLLQCSDRVIQFLGLYDIMSDLISKRYVTACKGTQEKVHDFFGKNRKQYPFIQFYESSKANKKNEDSFTHLRNEIAHSMQIGVEEFLEKSQGITFECIQKLLIVINSLLCETPNDEIHRGCNS